MSNVLYPTLPGLEFPLQREAMWKTDRKEAVSGRFYTSTYWSYPRWRWTLSYEFLREFNALNEYSTLFAFFNARGGRFDDFLFFDPDDNAANQATFGTGNGSQTQFRLARSMGGYLEPIGRVATITQVRVNGTPTVAYTLINDQTTVQFSVAPANGATLDWSGTHHWRVFFDSDAQSAEEFADRFWRSRQVQLVTQK